MPSRSNPELAQMRARAAFSCDITCPGRGAGPRWDWPGCDSDSGWLLKRHVRALASADHERLSRAAKISFLKLGSHTELWYASMISLPVANHTPCRSFMWAIARSRYLI